MFSFVIFNMINNSIGLIFAYLNMIQHDITKCKKIQHDMITQYVIVHI